MPILGVLASAITGNLAVPDTGAMFQLGMVSVGSGGTANITFSSIPSTYKHLQIRGIARTNRALTRDALKVTVNGNTDSSYGYHNLYGNGTSATAQGFGSEPNIPFNDIAGNTATANVFGVMIIDILDYASTTKVKTLRGLGGYDNDGSGVVGLNSGAYFGNTNALTSIKLESYGGTAFQQYTTFALYGIKGA